MTRAAVIPFAATYISPQWPQKYVFGDCESTVLTHADGAGDKGRDLLDTGNEASEEDTLGAMRVEEESGLLEMFRLEKPCAVTRPAPAIAAAQPIVEVIAEYRPGNVEPEQAGKLQVPQRGTAFGLYHRTVGLAALPGALLFGGMWQFWGAQSAFGLAATIVGIPMLGLLRGARTRPRA